MLGLWIVRLKAEKRGSETPSRLLSQETLMETRLTRNEAEFAGVIHALIGVICTFLSKSAHIDTILLLMLVEAA